MKRNIQNDNFTVFTNIIIALLAVAIVCLTIVITSRLVKGRYVYTVEPRSLHYEAVNGEYTYLLENKLRNEAAGLTSENNPEYIPYYALADYYLAASRYKVYMTMNDSQGMNTQRKIMNEAVSKMDALDYCTQDINELFGIDV
ncbi:MAG: hypothetical protein KBT19_03225 [Lachnospiraceae bacterium]|nr:hypothetical protein [Candidatus Colinaster equi]